MNTVLIWVWAAMALLFFIAEIFTAGFFLMCFGLGAVFAMFLAVANVEFIWQVVGFLVVSVVALVFLRPFASRVSSRTHNPGGIDRVVGKPAVVLEEINPVLATGRVRIEREEWRADTIEGETIPKDEIVEVVGVSGTRALVKRKRQQVM